MGLSNKKIVVFDTESQAKLCQVDLAHSKGIYGMSLLPEGQDAQIVTCSNDGHLKTWKLSEDSTSLENVSDIDLTGGSSDPNTNLLNVISFVKDGALNLVAVNLRGDIITCVGGSEVSRVFGAQDKVNSVTCDAQGNVLYSAMSNVLTLNDGAAKYVSGITANLPLEVLVSNGHSSYAGANSGHVHKINAGEVTGTAELGDLQVLDIGAGDEKLFVLTSKGNVHELDANTLAEVRQTPIPFPATCITYVKSTNELWLGQKKDLIHVLSADTYE